jgi:hypothetical protein
MQAIKGKTSHHLIQDYRRLRATFWGRHLWGPGYFVCSSGNVTDETIAEYVRFSFLSLATRGLTLGREIQPDSFLQQA